MNTKPKKLVILELEIPSLQTNQEGKLLGGFSTVPVMDSDPLETDGLCHGCTINKADCSDGCVPKKKKNAKKKCKIIVTL